MRLFAFAAVVCGFLAAAVAADGRAAVIYPTKHRRQAAPPAKADARASKAAGLAPLEVQDGPTGCKTDTDCPRS